MSDNGRTIRHAGNAIQMLVNGAVREIESRYADGESAECTQAIKDMIAHLHEELSAWEFDAE